MWTTKCERNNPRVSNFPSLQHDPFDLCFASLLFHRVHDVHTPSRQSAATTPDRLARFSHSRQSQFLRHRKRLRHQNGKFQWESLEEPDPRQIPNPRDVNLTLGLFFAKTEKSDSVVQRLSGHVSVFCFHKQIMKCS